MAAATSPTAPAPVTVRRSSRTSAALTKAKEATAATRKKLAELSKKYRGRKPIQGGRAAVVGAFAGAVHGYVALSVAGRAVPVALPAGVALLALGDDMLADAGADMIAAGSALATVDELRRMNLARR
jgi:hypothetical protein